VHGVLVVDKPAGITSHDVIDEIRRRWSVSKAGHLGTLDPGATGVLPVTIGKATRLARFIPSAPKGYEGTIRLGWETTTCDADGEPVGEAAGVELTAVAIAEAVASFQGRIQQIPPAYSAKKIAGVTAYRRARRGELVALSPVAVEIEEFSVVAIELPIVSFRVRCSPGTYIRSLARDLGRKLATGAHLETLRRTRSGPFDLEQAVPLEEAEPGHVIPSERLMPHIPEIHVDAEAEARVRHGGAFACGDDGSEGAPVRIFNKNGQLIAVATLENGWAHPRVVLV
jgi:tRNA pseudouridine55 synthase